MNPRSLTVAALIETPDGQRFLMTKTPNQPQAGLTQINMMLS